VIRRPSRAASLVLGGISVVFVAAYLFVALSRVRYRYELEWLESGLLAHVQRINGGHGIYVAPSPSFVPYPYPPLYVYLSAALSQVVGPPLEAMRLLSFAASLVVLGVLGWLAARETGRVACGVICAGVFAATYQASGAWFDLARVDSLYLALTLAAVAAARRLPESARRRAPAAAVAAGALLALAVLTKQTAIFAAPPIVWWLARVGPDRLWAWWLGGFGVLAGGVSAAMELTSHGWYGYWVVGQLSGHGLVGSTVISFWTSDLAGSVGLVAVAAMAGVIAKASRTGRERRLVMRNFWLPVLASLLAAAWVSRIHEGGYNNVLMPAFAAVALAVALSVGAALDHLDQLDMGKKYRAAAVATLLVVTGLVQTEILRYNPASLIPSAADRRSGRQFVDYIHGLAGDVWIPRHGVYAELAGKPGGADSGGINDVVLSGNTTVSGPLLLSVHAALAAHRYRAILLNGPEGFDGFPPDFDLLYSCQPIGLRVPTALTGRRTSPDRICTPRQ
jgi:hypothetical protein